MSRPLVIGVGNPYRRDDGVGPAVADLARREFPGIRALVCPAEPAAILDAWSGAGLAVVVDAAVGDLPGRVRRCDPEQFAGSVGLSSHDLDLAQTIELGRVLGRVPEKLVIVTVGVLDTGHGTGLTGPVAAALPEALAVVAATLREAAFDQREEASHQGA